VSTALIFWGVLFSAIGLGFFIYGKKQKVLVPLICGLALMIVPYFITNTFILVAVGAALIAAPYFF
jgi:hypothetical protein